MNTFAAFANGEASRHKTPMVFDWDKAARLIKERQPQEASAGLSQDWEWTGGAIYKDGAPVTDSYTYLQSTWATPELDMDGDVVDCFCMKPDCIWNENTKWPESALAILKD